jgi:hypothetical protein
MSKGADKLLQCISEAFPSAMVQAETPLSEFGARGNLGRLRIDYYMFRPFKVAYEFHGSQHFAFTSHFHQDESGFTDSKWRDRAKREFLFAHGIPLVEYSSIDDITVESVFKVTMDFLSEASEAEPVRLASFSVDPRRDESLARAREYRRAQYRKLAALKKLLEASK